MTADKKSYFVKCEECGGTGEVNGDYCRACFGLRMVLSKEGLAMARRADDRMMKHLSS